MFTSPFHTSPRAPSPSTELSFSIADHILPSPVLLTQGVPSPTSFGMGQSWLGQGRQVSPSPAFSAVHWGKHPAPMATSPQPETGDPATACGWLLRGKGVWMPQKLSALSSPRIPLLVCDLKGYLPNVYLENSHCLRPCPGSAQFSGLYFPCLFIVVVHLSFFELPLNNFITHDGMPSKFIKSTN